MLSLAPHGGPADGAVSVQHHYAGKASLPSPVSSNSAGTALGAPSSSQQSAGSPLGDGLGSCAETGAPCVQHQQQQQQQGYAGMLAGASSSKRFNAARYIQDKEWLYRLITFPSYFTPCGSCCGSARTPKREQLMTQFDTEYPYRVYCSHCPECKDRINSGCLLQVRRSAFKDVVKANDICRFGADVAGVQQYTLNGSKVIYLNREQTPEKKGNNTNAAPAACSVDGRAMMDKSSTYCSLKCKLIAEDAGFTRWLDTQDPSVRILALAAANAPPRPTAASKRAAGGGPDSSASSGGSGACADTTTSSGAITSRPHKLARTDSNGAAASSGRPAPLQRASSASAAPSSSQQQGPAGPGLKRIRISLAGQRRQASAPSGFLEAALAPEPLAASAAGDSWMELDHALSCTMDGWDLGSSLDSPCFTAPGSGLQGGATTSGSAFENDGSMSPALINAPSVFSTGSGDDWWLCGSPVDGAFTCAGMGALLNAEPAGMGGCADDLFAGGVSSLSGAMLVAPAAAPAGGVGSLGVETTIAGLQW